MKVPMLDMATGALQRPLYNSAGPNLVKPDMQVAQAVEGAGKQALGLAGAVLAQAEEARKQALGISLAEGLTSLESDTVRALEGDSEAGTQGYLSTQGQEAHARAADTLKGLQKRASDIEGKLPLEARAEFRKRSQAALVDTQRRVEGHAARQFQVAQAKALDGARAAALRRIATGDATSAMQAMGEVERTISEVLPAGERQAALEAWREESALEIIKRDLVDEAPEAAAAKLQGLKERLGVRYDDAKRAVDQALGLKKKASEVESVDVEAEKVAMDIVSKSVVEGTRWVDRSAAEAALDAMPPGKVKDEARRRLDARLAAREREKAQAVDQHYNAGLAVYQKTGSLEAIDPKVRAWLQDPKNDPEAWQKLEDMRERDADRWRRISRERTGDEREKAAARREQKGRDREVLNLYVTELLEGRLDTDPGRFASEHGGLSPEGVSELVRKQAEYRAKAKSGEAADLSRWRSKAQEIARRDAIDPKTKKRRYDEQTQADLQAEMFEAYERKQTALGRRLTAEEEQAIESQALLKMETGKRTGVFGLGKKEVLPAGVVTRRARAGAAPADEDLAPPPPPAGEDMVRVLLNGKPGRIARRNLEQFLKQPGASLQ